MDSSITAKSDGSYQRSNPSIMTQRIGLSPDEQILTLRNRRGVIWI